MKFIITESDRYKAIPLTDLGVAPAGHIRVEFQMKIREGNHPMRVPIAWLSTAPDFRNQFKSPCSLHWNAKKNKALSGSGRRIKNGKKVRVEDKSAPTGSLKVGVLYHVSMLFSPRTRNMSCIITQVGGGSRTYLKSTAPERVNKNVTHLVFGMSEGLDRHDVTGIYQWQTPIGAEFEIETLFDLPDTTPDPPPAPGQFTKELQLIGSLKTTLEALESRLRNQ